MTWKLRMIGVLRSGAAWFLVPVSWLEQGILSFAITIVDAESNYPAKIIMNSDTNAEYKSFAFPNPLKSCIPQTLKRSNVQTLKPSNVRTLFIAV
jgi:hypothetical protein